MTLDPAVLQATSVAGYMLVFLGGIVTSIGPCNIAMIPLIIGYVSGSSDLSRGRSFSLSLTFAVGLAVTYVLLGLVAAAVGGLIGGTGSVLYYVVAVVCFVLGLQMLGIINIQLPVWFAGLQQRVTLRGLPGALALGLVSGLVASQCATPVLAAIVTYVMASGDALVYGAALLFVYALGRGVPVVLAGTFTGFVKHMDALARWSRLIERAGGAVMLAVGLYFVWIA